MPVQDCVGTRDSITQSLGRVLSNHFDYPDSSHIITSYCRTTDGTWIAWKNTSQGASFDSGNTTLDDALSIKATWQTDIASANAVGVGFFPDDESSAVVYELGIDPIYTWEFAGDFAGRDPCSWWPLLGDKYSDNSKSQLTGWSMAPIDVQVRTDGTNVWVIALAREAVEYPYLYNSPLELDKCGHIHPTFVEYWNEGHSDPFFHDTDSGERWWYYRKGLGGGDEPFGAYDDPGEDNSFRWQAARVTVWAGDIGGFTKLDTIEAQFNNSIVGSGLCSGVEAAASATEPGVLHLLWAEGGQFGFQTVEPKRGQRVNYSRWDFTGKTLDADMFRVEEDGSGFVSDGNWVWTAEMILRNDHGSPIAIVWPWVTDGGPQFVSPNAEFWDLADGTADILQTADTSLAPTADEGNMAPVPASVFGTDFSASSIQAANLRRSQYASSLYTDPTLDNTDVYLLCVGYGDEADRSSCKAFLRVPVDGSDTFTYMDGVRLVNYSIIPDGSFNDPLSNVSLFTADFVSDTQNVWMPAEVLAGGAILHLTRICERTWELLPAWPDNGIPGSGFETGDWGFGTNGQNAQYVNPPYLVTDDSGSDWIVGAGNGPQLAELSTDPVNIAAIRARICRCCVPCQERTGLHVWQVL